MTPTTAILQVADQGPLESLVLMLEAAGMRCLLPDAQLRGELRAAGLDTVCDPEGLHRGLGYDMPFPMAPATVKDMERRDVLYVDVKAHRAYPKVVKRWPNLKGRVLWYRINGSKPEHVIRWCDGCRKLIDSGCRKTSPCRNCEDMGDEVNPPCPVLTPNQWYSRDGSLEMFSNDGMREAFLSFSYACWPPFVRFDEYAAPRPDKRGKNRHIYANPICLIHNFQGWGYGALTVEMERLGVRIHGAGSPDGLLQHREVPLRLSNAFCMVHLKSSDAPGYALYEALAAACPVVCTRRLIWRCRMQELLVPGETCLVFDRETHDPLSPQDVLECREEVRRHLEWLAVPENNARLGEAGRRRLREVMWSPGNGEHVASLREFLERCFR